MHVTPTTTIALLLSALALSACQAEGGETDASAATTDATASEPAAKGDAKASDLAMAETGWLTVGADGAVQTTFFDPDGRYRDLRNGNLLAQGSWERRSDGMLCFEPDSGLGACWKTGPVGDDGEAIATDTTGKRITIRRVTYIAPPASGDGDGTES